MIVISYDNLLAQIKSKKSKVIYFYEGHSALNYSDTSIRPFDKLVSSTGHEDLSKQIEEFADVYASKFTVFIHTADNGVERFGYILHVDLAVRKAAALPAVTTDGSQPINYATVKAEILKELTEAKQHEVVQTQLTDANAQIAQQKFMSEKLAAVGIQILYQLGVIDPTAGLMQGLQPNTNEPAVTTPTTPPAPTTAIEAAEAAPAQQIASKTPEEALKYLREQLGDEALMKLDVKIRANKGLIQTLKTFAG